MDAHRFDALTRGLFGADTRRSVLARLGAAAGLAALLPRDVEGKKRKKKKKKAKLNEFDCVDVGNFCKNASQCCSNICEGKKCRAHNASTCVAGQTLEECGGVNIACQTDAGDPAPGLCAITTGKAGFCLVSGDCFTCKKDLDCVAVCGPLAACLPCASCASQIPPTLTACVAPTPGACSI